MLKSNSELRTVARASLSNKWGISIAATLIVSLILGGTTAVIVGILLLPLQYGASVFFLEQVRGKSPEIGGIFEGFNDYGRVLSALLLVAIYTFLWSLLFVIPGIVKMYSYSMTSYILKDNTNITSSEAIDKSIAMMQGNKGKLFMLDLSFIGWCILSVATCGIGFLFLTPYVSAARAAFYEDVKNQTIA